VSAEPAGKEGGRGLNKCGYREEKLISNCPEPMPVYFIKEYELSIPEVEICVQRKSALLVTCMLEGAPPVRHRLLE
jgi:hypothetical protein